jgi:GMP reductase
MMTALHKHYTEDQLVEFFTSEPELWNNVFYTVGISDSDYEKLMAVRERVACFSDEQLKRDSAKWQNCDYHSVIRQFPRFLNIDVANGYSSTFLDAVKQYHVKRSPHSVIMAGNVVTGNMVEELIIGCGAHICKVGIGSGAVCTSRLVAGVGYPQLSAVIECADAAHGVGGRICSDGGCVNPGDVSKAIGGGADYVMLGGMLAGTDECEGEWVEGRSDCDKSAERGYYDSLLFGLSAEKQRQQIAEEGTDKEVTIKMFDGECRTFESALLAIICVRGILNDASVGPERYLKFHGMSSKEAQEKWNGGLAGHRASEGKEVLVPYKGSADSVVQQVTGGCRSACTYTGAEKLKDLPKCCTFVRVNRQYNDSLGK